MTRLIDTHLHLDMDAFEGDQEKVVLRASQVGVEKMITIGCNLYSSQNAIAIAEKYPTVYASVGVHPHQASSVEGNELDCFPSLFEHVRVVAVGEVGLDYYYLNSTKEDQKRVFCHFSELAAKHRMPLIIHSRDAEEDTLEILSMTKKSMTERRGVIHCFNGSLSFAQSCLDLGFYISLSGMLTFSKSLQKVVKKLPLDRLLIETDAPFLAPTPYRGQRNEPAFVVETAKTLSKILSIPYPVLAEQTSQNAQTLFMLD